MKAILKNNPRCQWFIGRAELLRTLSMHSSDSAWRGLYRTAMRNEAKSAIFAARTRLNLNLGA
jgi:hypothetical protein